MQPSSRLALAGTCVVNDIPQTIGTSAFSPVSLFTVLREYAPEHGPAAVLAASGDLFEKLASCRTVVPGVQHVVTEDQSSGRPWKKHKAIARSEVLSAASAHSRRLV